MELTNIKYVYLLGIGGIGMSALARYFHIRGIKVKGYDKTSTRLTVQMMKDGIDISYQEETSHLKDKPDLLIYTPAIPSDNKELIYCKEHRIPILKRSEVLGLITKDKFTIAVAGTHGKTTITSIISHIFNHAGIPITAFIGGVSKNLDGNFIDSKDSKLTIVEADEYDRSFLTLSPDIAIVSAMDADHLDIYGSAEALIDSFKLFAGNLKKNGILIAKSPLEINHPLFVNKKYSLNEECDYFVSKITINDGKYLIDLHLGDEILNNISISIGGKHNIENCIAAAAAAYTYELSSEEIKSGLESYLGVHRRFDIIYKSESTIYIDDYAHHPEELNVCINSARELFPNKKITGIFQPHLFSRTRDFADEFANSLALLDEIILLDIYPAREKPINGISSAFLLNKIKKANKKIMNKNEVIDYISDSKPELLLTLGAGDIDQLIEPLKKTLNN